MNITLPAGSTLTLDNGLSVTAEKPAAAEPVTKAPSPLKFATYVASDGSTSTGAMQFRVAVRQDGTGLCGCEDFIDRRNGLSNCKHIDRAIRRGY
jgi:hypothetical protein